MSTLLDQLSSPCPIVLAPTGMVPTRAMTPHVPLTPAEIAADVRAAAEVGISSVHLHARDEDGEPAWERRIYAEIIDRVRSECPDVVINVSTSGRTWSEVEKRADVLALDGDLKPDMASLTLSSLNFMSGASVNAPDTVRPPTLAKVRAAIKSLGFRPDSRAQNMRRRHTMTIGFVVDDIANPLHACAFKAADAAMRERGFSLYLVNSNGRWAIVRESTGG